MHATRLAAFDGVTTASAEQSIQPVRTAWFDSPALEATAVSTGGAARLARLDAAVTGESQGVLDDLALTVYRGAVVKGTPPALATTWLAESRVEKIRVRQIAAKANAVSRARSRALANTALGFSTLTLGAEVATDPLRVSTIHAFTGATTGSLEALADPLRIRIIEGRMPGEAETRAAPTITTASGRYSYNSGVMRTSSPAIQGVTKVHRRPPPAAAYAQATAGTSQTFLRRGVRGVVNAAASASITTRGNSWQFAEAKAQASAALDNQADVYRWRVAGPGSSAALAESLSTNSIAAYVSGDTASGFASSDSTPWAIRPMLASEGATEAVTTATGVRQAGVSGAAAGEAVDEKAFQRTAYLDGLGVSVAEAPIDPERHAYMSAAPAMSEALSAGASDRTAWMLPSQLGSSAECLGDNSRQTWGVNAPDTGLGAVAIQANVYTLRNWGEQALGATASEQAEALRWVYVAAPDTDATAVSMKFVYRINAGTPAPSNRTLVLGNSDRLFALTASNREYRVQ
jgi:hypothetical protein